MKLKINRLIFPFLVLLLFFSCKKEERSSIPDEPVYVETTYSEFMKLQITYNSIIYTNPPLISGYAYGYGGIVIFRGTEGSLRCYDLSCPYEALPNIRVAINGFLATCPQCGSRYNLDAIGAPMSGPSKQALRRYNSIRETTTKITVYN